MRIGFISDVHANLEALTAVLTALERARVDRVISLGDAVGYNANPNECVELLARAGALVIAGNHDRAAIGALEPSDFGARAQSAISWTRRVLRPEHAARLAALDVFAWHDARTCLVHAALHPAPNDQYHLSTPRRVAASFAKLHSGAVPARLCFFGHTHHAAIHASDGRRTRELPRSDGPVKLELERSYYLVNPGSVGEPRETDRRASYAVFDEQACTLELLRVGYDVERALSKVQAAGLLTAPRKETWRWL